MDNISEVIDELYNKSGYADRYGFDIWMTFLLCLVFFTAISYYHIKNNIEPIKADWASNRCRPDIIPFAGIINKDPNETAFEYTERNFNECTQSILKTISDKAFEPFYYLLSVLTEFFSSLVDAVNAMRKQFNHVRESVKAFAENIMGRILNITTPVVVLFITAKSILQKVIGTITATIYTLIGSYFGMKSFMMFFMRLIVQILLGLVATITGLWIGSAFLPFLIPTAISTTAVMAAILIPTIIIQVLMNDVMELGSAPPPSVPACFAGDTKIKMQNNIEKNISDVCVGDLLSDGSKITGTMILMADGQNMYKIGNVNVTAEHSIYHQSKGWIRVDEHPESIKLNKFEDPFLYCVNTDTKVIKIGKHTFSDWDDLDDDDLERLNRNDKIPSDITLIDVHQYFDTGFEGSTQIKLSNGDMKPISNLEIHDVLQFGEKVCGMVKVDCDDIVSGVIDYHLNDAIVSCTSNIVLVGDVSNTLNPIRLEIVNATKRPKYVYHILTDTGSFVVQGFRFGDYNKSIENYL